MSQSSDFLHDLALVHLYIHSLDTQDLAVHEDVWTGPSK